VTEEKKKQNPKFIFTVKRTVSMKKKEKETEKNK